MAIFCMYRQQQQINLLSEQGNKSELYYSMKNPSSPTFNSYILALPELQLSKYLQYVWNWWNHGEIATLVSFYWRYTAAKRNMTPDLLLRQSGNTQSKKHFNMDRTDVVLLAEFSLYEEIWHQIYSWVNREIPSKKETHFNMDRTDVVLLALTIFAV